MNEEPTTVQSNSEEEQTILHTAEPRDVVATQEDKSVAEVRSVAKEETEEEKEYKKLLIPFERYPKLKRWVEFFTDKDNKATYGNRTESAVQAGYDCKTRADFATIGSQNYRKFNALASVFAEDRGITMDKIMDVVAARALTHNNPRWFELFTEMINIRDPKGASFVVNNNTQNNQINISDGEAQDFNKAFKRFLESE